MTVIGREKLPTFDSEKIQLDLDKHEYWAIAHGQVYVTSRIVNEALLADDAEFTPDLLEPTSPVGPAFAKAVGKHTFHISKSLILTWYNAFFESGHEVSHTALSDCASIRVHWNNLDKPAAVIKKSIPKVQPKLNIIS